MEGEKFYNSGTELQKASITHNGFGMPRRPKNLLHRLNEAVISCSFPRMTVSFPFTYFIFPVFSLSLSLSLSSCFIQHPPSHNVDPIE